MFFDSPLPASSSNPTDGLLHDLTIMLISAEPATPDTSIRKVVRQSSSSDFLLEENESDHEPGADGNNIPLFLSDGQPSVLPTMESMENPSGLSAYFSSTARQRQLPKRLKDHSKNHSYKTTLQDHMRMLAAQGVAANQQQTIALRAKCISEHVIRNMNDFGWAVVDNFLGKSHCGNIHREVSRLFEIGLFSAGKLVDSGERSAKEIRSDETYWFDSSDPRTKECTTARLLISMLDSVVAHFRDRIKPHTISGRSKAMIAVFPGNGTRYIKHVDNPVKDGRCITSIYYCNEDWNLTEHGGTLRLYPESSPVPMDIDPKADRLIFFFSDKRNPHEVLPVFHPRFAITIWYFDHDEKMRALERKRQKGEESGGSMLIKNS